MSMATSAKAQGAIQVLRELEKTGTGERKTAIVAAKVEELGGDLEYEGSIVASKGTRDGALIAIQALRDGGASGTTIKKAMKAVDALTPGKSAKDKKAEEKRAAEVAKAEADAQAAEDAAEEARNPTEDDEDNETEGEGGGDGAEKDDPPKE